MSDKTADNGRPARFITAPVFREAAFGSFHPLSISRHASVIALAEALGWLGEGDVEIVEPASRAVLARFHEGAYLDAFEAAARALKVTPEIRERYGLGTAECPLFKGVWERAATTVGGAIRAAELALEGKIAFHPAGGTHHGRRDKAVGFCYFNDPVFAILTLLDKGLERVFYLDLDAHHGDGVEAAFSGDPRVMTVSIHEEGRWPHTGEAGDRAGGNARNFPVPKGFNDSELAFLMETSVLPVAKGWGAQAVVVACGTDALQGDPLARLALTNSALWRAVEEAVALTPHAVVLGGGGYNPWLVARCWAGLWGRLSGKPIPERLPPAAREVLSSLDCDLVDEEEVAPAWLETLEDKPNEGPVRGEVWRLAALAGA